MANNFRNIDYGKMLYEALRNYFSVNSDGQITVLYKYCACFLQPLQLPFNNYDAARQINALVAQCRWQIGQLTNVLNFLFDTIQKRIFITQAKTSVLSAPSFPYNTPVQVRGFGSPAQAQARGFGDNTSTSKVVFNVPVGVNISNITAIIEQIRIQGIPYVIQTF